MIKHLTKVPTRITRTGFTIVAAGILFVTVARLPELADQLQQMQGLASSARDASVNPVVNARLDDQSKQAIAELDRLRAMMIAANQLPAIQNELLLSARECGCQIRRVAIQSGYADSWRPSSEAEGDDPTEQAADAAGIQETLGYDVNTEHILLSLTGSFDQICKFAQQVREKPWMCKFSQLNVSRMPDERGRLSMEATIAFVRMNRKAKEEFINWQTEPPRSSVQ